MSDTVCFICDNELTVNDFVVVKKKGIISLINASVVRNDEKDSVLRGLDSIKVHINCRKQYARIDRIKPDEITNNSDVPIKSPIKAQLRSARPLFNFKLTCFFCAENIDDDFLKNENKKPANKRRKVFNVRSLTLRGSILQMALNRDDEFGKIVWKRIIGEPDLVAAEAIYHHDCYVKFSRIPSISTQKRGRPKVSNISESMDIIFKYIEESEECQFSIDDLIEELDGYKPDKKTVSKKLMEKYGSDIIISSGIGTTFCFKSVGNRILNENWYSNRSSNVEEERLRIIYTAAEIIREDIRSQVHDLTSYDSCFDFLKNVDTVVPNTLKVFLDEVIITKKKKRTELTRKSTAIAHSIMAATRPKSFISPLQLGLSVMLHRKFESKNIINILCNLGFCASYREALLFEASSLYHPEPDILPNSFSQFIFDNADFNINTLDGLNTFHSMGGIQCVTPSSSVCPVDKINRLKIMPSSQNIGNVRKINIKIFEPADKDGIKNLIFDNLNNFGIDEQIELSLPHLLWILGKFIKNPSVPGWTAFMAKITQNKPFSQSRIVPLPFVNLPPSNYDTINTVLHFASKKCSTLDQNTCVITFDQPLYIKARDIVAKSPNLSNVIVRLGGFHLLMSFLGAVGYIMAGSGLKEIFSTIYAPITADKMLTGHAYSRAVRGHTLVHLALSNIILQSFTISDEEKKQLNDLFLNFNYNPIEFDQIYNENVIIQLCKQFKNQLDVLKKNGATSKLWLQYFDMISLMKEYITAERMGNWKLHLQCVEKMIPYFHASGHFPYAKSCHLYLNDMANIQYKMTAGEQFRFINESDFTIRRTNQFWSGNWSDMTIEQTLMRSMKTIGGLTHGRGITDSTLNKWIQGLPAAHDVCENLEKYCGVYMENSEQHVDARLSRISRDTNDLNILLKWFSSHPPFLELNEIISISTGVVGDTTINCHNAYEIGLIEMKKIIGQTYGRVKLKRSNRVLPIAIVNSSIRIREEIISIDPLLIFQRISIMKTSNEELKSYFEYELSPYPLSLFNEMGMRKTKKSILYDFIQSSNLESFTLSNALYVIDGGFLLHRVMWQLNLTFNQIFQLYLSYISKHFGTNAVIVFDGYNESTTSTKNMERNRRVKNTSADILFDENMVLTVAQTSFLSNIRNKSRLIQMLSSYLIGKGYIIKQANDDADTVIVNEAIKRAQSQSVVVVGQDIDLLVLLIAFTPVENQIIFLKPGNGGNEKKIYSIQDIQKVNGIKMSILFLHAISGCDTVSCFYNIGKLKHFKLLNQYPELQGIVNVFNCPNSTPENIFKAGERYTLKLYGAPQSQTNIDEYRYLLFTRKTAGNKFKLASLPPSKEALKQHIYRTYHQVQMWHGEEKNAKDWGWQTTRNGLQPIFSWNEPAPKCILEKITCACTKNCGAACGCRKQGLKCSTACKTCSGLSCLNCEQQIIEEESDDNYNEDGDEVVYGPSSKRKK